MMCMTVICPHLARHAWWAVHINPCNYYYFNASKPYFYGFISFYFLARSILHATVAPVWVSWTLCNTLCKFWSSREADVKVGLGVLETHWETGLWGVKGKGRSRQGSIPAEIQVWQLWGKRGKRMWCEESQTVEQFQERFCQGFPMGSPVLVPR